MARSGTQRRAVAAGDLVDQADVGADEPLEGLPLAMVSLGGSRKNVTVVLPEVDAVAAMRRLHRRFFEPEPTEADCETLTTA